MTSPGLISLPHTVPGLFLIGGPSNAGALFVDWAGSVLRGPARPGGPAVDAQPGDGDRRAGDPGRVPVWLPYLRGERTPFHDPGLRASVHGLDISQGPEACSGAPTKRSGFVIRRMINRSAAPAHRIVATGGGSRSRPVDAGGGRCHRVAGGRRWRVPEGAALGAAYLARMAAGPATSFDGAGEWASTGRRIEPDPAWSAAASARVRAVRGPGPVRRGAGPDAGRPAGQSRFGAKAAFTTPLSAGTGQRLERVPPVLERDSGGSTMPVRSIRPACTRDR